MSTNTDTDMLNLAAKKISEANRCVCFTGAGMSKDSGIDTFRGSGGFWSGIFGNLAIIYGGTPIGWSLTPGLVWSYFLSSFYEPIASANFHVGYTALARLEKQFKTGNYSTITMNVDGFHEASGANPDSVYEVHGTIKRFRCIKCADSINIPDPLHESVRKNPPKCESCGGYPRPDVTLFTESLPQNEWARSLTAAKSLSRGDVMLVVGTSSVVYPAASLPQYAKERGATIIEVNPDERTPLVTMGVVDMHLRGTAAELLPDLVEKVINHRS